MPTLDPASASLPAVEAAGAPVEVFDYSGSDHFTDASLPAEHDAAAPELLWERVLVFCAKAPGESNRFDTA